MFEPKVITREEREARWRGLGDVVASATKAIGIQPCQACKQRQEALNKLVPFTNNVEPAPTQDKPNC